MLAPFLVFMVIDLLFVVLGILFLCGKGSSLIAGYNTASKFERARYNERALCKAMGWLMFALAICWFITALNFLFESMILLAIGLILFFIVCIAGIVYINTSKKIKRK